MTHRWSKTNQSSTYTSWLSIITKKYIIHEARYHPYSYIGSMCRYVCLNDPLRCYIHYYFSKGATLACNIWSKEINYIFSIAHFGWKCTYIYRSCVYTFIQIWVFLSMHKSLVFLLQGSGLKVIDRAKHKILKLPSCSLLQVVPFIHFHSF